MTYSTHIDVNAKCPFEEYAEFAAACNGSNIFEPLETWPKPGTPEATALQYAMRDWNTVPIPFRQNGADR